MAIVIGKGSVYQHEVASTLTAIGQLYSIDLPEHAIETFEADTFDNSNDGIPYKPSGRVEGGSVTISGFLDPALASFQILTDRINAPTPANTDTGAKIIFADSGTSEWAFDTAGLSLGGTIVLNDGVKFTCTIKLDGAIESFPT